MVSRKAYLLDIGYAFRDGQTYAKLLLKSKKAFRLYYPYDPYFYVHAPLERAKDLEKIVVKRKNGEIASPLRVEKTEKNLFGGKTTLLKVVCRNPSDVPAVREAVPYDCYENRIPYTRRFLLDFQLEPFSIIHYEREGRIIKKIKKTEPASPELSFLSFDIEVYNPLGSPREDKDPVIMVSHVGKEKGLITFKDSKKKFVKTVEGEKALIEAFSEIVKKEDPDIILGYNSSAFDIPYLKARAEKLKADFNIGRWKDTLRKIRKGMLSGIEIDGRIHLDVYPGVRFFGFIGLFKARVFTLENIYEEISGTPKPMVPRDKIWKIWDEGDIEELAEYCLMDSIATKEVADLVLPIQRELSSITKMPLFDVSLATSGQLVEHLLMFKAVEKKMIFPKRPTDASIRERMRNPIKGAYVRLPEPGVYENIAVLDFRSLYPTIIVSYNIDPFTITKDEKKPHHLSPFDTMFLKKPMGLVPYVLDWLVDYRAKIKKQLKKLDKDSKEYQKLKARSHALKILSNSFYGFLVYPRGRWYNRDCGESITAWGRKHIMDTMERAEKAGFTVLYGDTDSLMLLYDDKKKMLDFIEKINSELPEKMELELEEFYTRGVFVSKKAEEKGAKKKYALLGEDGRIKIRGFELVRRDWSHIARDTQLKVLEAILKDGSKEKAVKIVRDVINKLREGKVDLKELVINTQLTRDPDSYEVKSPELSAANKAIEKGVPIERGSIISFVITKSGKTISEKAVPVDFAEDYDVDYYIDNQILPAVMKILKELGYEEYDLKVGGKQKKLDSFFG